MLQAIEGNHDLLLAALANLLGNALKFTHAHTQVILCAYAVGDRVFIDVKDHCGGVAADDGQLSVENFPGVGCAFTINLPRRIAP